MAALCFGKSCFLREVLTPIVTSRASLKYWKKPPNLKDVELPEHRKLPLLDKVPPWLAYSKAVKMYKNLIDIRGPELIRNKLIYKQYGIIALSGTNLKHGHLEMIRNIINKRMDVKRTFAVWGIDSPWKPITKKSQGKRMGGGKGSIAYYVTPIRAGRIIVEVGGAVEYEEVYPYLNEIVEKLPCDAMVVSEEIMQELEEEEQKLVKANINPFTFESVIKNNLQNCHQWISKYDKIWFGKYI
ncbi:39S ribosomal protein L16, mitochondrial-like [Centruroides sculpturatus]|uniref:39S ribosomal protein L16, mitochondrial-like n=1 Tax=Centruroides sculpturatus TaxID=218467 RepID=UPI000C6D2960|nr:39S ribosomal protein L16, mitochondrial-like [Centruroides sculpturatus]